MGLGPNVTLDATINPDFGQVEADPAVINLSAFETRFEERNLAGLLEGAEDGSLDAAMASGRDVVSSSFIIPYPPGFPILVPGQVVSQPILDFMRALDVKEIHGYRPELGLRVFTDAALGLVPREGEAKESKTAAE